jgi:DNA gyrase subunit B
MADADVDGSHIRTLLITLFARYLRPAIEAGRLYAAMPPLHKITTKGRNAETIYTYTQVEMASTVARLEKAGRQIITPIPRFKGLGEMDADELWDTTMNPATRAVRRITLQDAEAADRVLELLMGEKVEPRKNWLIDSADRVDRESIDA